MHWQQPRPTISVNLTHFVELLNLWIYDRRNCGFVEEGILSKVLHKMSTRHLEMNDSTRKKFTPCKTKTESQNFAM